MHPNSVLIHLELVTNLTSNYIYIRVLLSVRDDILKNEPGNHRMIILKITCIFVKVPFYSAEYTFNLSTIL